VGTLFPALGVGKNISGRPRGGSLAPPKRGEGWGEGNYICTNIILLTPPLSSFKGGEGDTPVQDRIPNYFKLGLPAARRGN